MISRDLAFMQRALELAARGGVRTAPNPQVGAVVVRKGRIVGEGYHRRFGGPHAEAHALRAAGPRARGATLYVTLEPCSPHPKKTPPCTDLIVRSGLARVVVAQKDPNPHVSGRGLSLLRRAGLAVTTGVGAAQAARLNAAYLKVRRTGLPYVAVKWAMSLDGKISTRTGDSKWITSERSRRWARRWRDTFQAILVGRGTVLEDDPMLRGSRTRPVRVILDSRAQIPVGSRVVTSARRHATLVAVGARAPRARLRRLQAAGVRVLRHDPKDLPGLFARLAREGFHRILVEGGGEVHASVIGAPGLADEALIFIAPKILGGRSAKTPVEGAGVATVAEAWALRDLQVERRGVDLVLRGSFGP